jgi:phage-related protein
MPQKAAVVALDVPGQPTTAPNLRGDMNGTTTNIANNNRAHVCDISAEMSRGAAWVKMQYGVVVEAVRKAIRAVLNALGFTPDATSSRLTELAKAIKAEAKKIKKILDEVNNVIEVFSRFVTQVQQMIQWILSLPAKALALLKECLTELQQSLTKSFTDLFTPTGTSSFVSDIQDIASTVKDVASSALTTVNNAVAAATEAAATVTVITSLKDPVAGLKLN